jgi:topoisomerase-4 subunit A
VAIGEPAERWLLASDAGYGFIVKLEYLHSRQRAGKAVLNLTANAKVLIPVPLAGTRAAIAAVNSEGQMLVFPSDEVPEMVRGKGNKMFGIPTKKAESREETLVAVATLVEGQKLVVWCGERSMTLSWKELEPHRGARAQRGAMLSRNYRTVDRLEVTGG